MPEDGLTVRRLLPEQFQRMDEVVKSRLLDDPAVGKAGLPGLVWPIVGTKATQAVCSVLDCDVFGLLARAWQTARELHEFKDEARYPPGKPFTTFLGAHDLATSLHPLVDVTFGPALKSRLKFTVELNAAFHAARLTITSGHITAIEAGECTVSAQLKYGEFDLHKKLESKEAVLTRPLLFPEPGLAIL